MQKRACHPREIGNPVTFNVSRHGIPAYAETTYKWVYKFSLTRNTTLNRLQNIQRTRHPFATLIQHMGVNHRRRHIFVAKQFLHGANEWRKVCGGPSCDGEIRQKRLDLGRAQITWMTLVKMNNEAFSSIDIGLLGANALVLHEDFAENLIEKLGLSSRNGHDILGCAINRELANT